jgi:hypothetical protein
MTMTANSDAQFLSFRPKSYFRPLDLKDHLLSIIKGAERRRHVEKLLAEGELTIVQSDLLRPTLSDADRSAAGAIHPALMGGEYLPDRGGGEVEIARITLASTLQDVTCVYARREGSRIELRVVDEHEGMTLTDATQLSVEAPLTLGGFVDFFLGGFDLLEVLEMNFADDGYDRDAVLTFFEASSVHYPQFDRALRDRVEAWLEERQPDPDPEDEY